jgi:hypothetical protein
MRARLFCCISAPEVEDDGMSYEELDAEVEKLRHRAKRNLNRMFDIPEGTSSGTVEQIVDDIISCATIRIAVLQLKAAHDPHPIT